MSAAKKNYIKDQGTNSTATQTRSVADLTQVGGLGTDLPDTKKFELVPVINFVSGPEKGRVVSIAEKIIIGRSKSCNVTITDPSCSRQHAMFEFKEGRIFVEDLKSTNGVRVNGARLISSHQLEEGDRIQLGDLTIVRFGYMPHAEASLQQDFYQRATRDSLTSAYNRKSFEEAFDREIAHCKRNARGLGLLLFDLDHFKLVNDTHGHAAGDAVLRRVSEEVHRLIRAEDVFARIGGEEFALLTRNESMDALRALGERLRSTIESVELEWESIKIRVTISVGVAFMVSSPTSPAKDELFKAADTALYSAKNSGRNKVMAAPQE